MWHVAISFMLNKVTSLWHVTCRICFPQINMSTYEAVHSFFFSSSSSSSSHPPYP
jgi:hypothetical protein